MTMDDLPGNEAMRTFLDKLSTATNVTEWGIELPMIATMGDTSSGKSSLLSNLANVELPSSHSLTTRCPILLQMRRAEVREARVSVQWKSSATVNDDESQGATAENNSNNNSFEVLPEFEERIATEETWDCIPDYLQEAQAHILKYTRKDVAPDIISLKLSGPDAGVSTQQPLTLIDLPGLARSRGEEETESLIPDIQALVEEYLKNPRCIILAVVPANVDFHNSQIMAEAKRVDPETQRTIPVITKPDLIDAGAEDNVLALLMGKKISFSLGFHMIKGRGQASLDSNESIQDGLQKEAIFFERSEPWKSVQDRSFFGTHLLREKLGKIMMQHIKQTVPTILQEIRYKQQHAQSQIDLMGKGAHSTVADRRRYYQEICQSLVSQLKNSLSGKGRSSSSSANSNNPSAAARLHEACTEFMDNIRAGSLANDQNCSGRSSGLGHHSQGRCTG
jgi:GTP-binding protein EngB required for normal cell division